MKVTKTQLARDLNVDRRKIEKYLNGYQPSNTRKRKLKIDAYYEVSKLLLLNESLQKLIKRVLWQISGHEEVVNSKDFFLKVSIEIDH